MRIRVLLVIIALGCGSTPPPPPPAFPDDMINQDEAILEAVANRYVAALMRGDRVLMQKLTMTYDQMASLTTKQLDRADYNRQVTDFIDARVREQKEAQKKGDTSIAVSFVEKKTLSPSEKLTRQIELAVVKVVVTENGREHDAPFPMLFIKVDGRWRYTFMK